MNSAQVNTDGLCEGLQRGDKYKIRTEMDEATHFFEEGAEVVIMDFVKGSPPAQCKNSEARLLVFVGHEPSQWHPLWIINCHECPFYDLTLTGCELTGCDERPHVNKT